MSEAIGENDLAVVSVLSGNRNFEGRINPDVKMNYLASPPLVVAYALAGSMDADIVNDPIGVDRDGVDVYLRDLWPSGQEVGETVERAVRSEMFRSSYDDVFAGDERWNSLDVPTGDRFAWDESSTYVHLPPYFEGMPAEPAAVSDIEGARVLALLGDSVTTDHISPAGSIKPDSPAGLYLQEHGVSPRDFNSYGARRGNHEVMVRGTFANIRLRNQLAPGTEGGVTTEVLRATRSPRADADLRGGAGSTWRRARRWWCSPARSTGRARRATGRRRGRACWACARCWRSPSSASTGRTSSAWACCRCSCRASAEDLGLTGEEVFSIIGLADPMNAGDPIPDEVLVRADDREFKARVRIDTPKEAEYFRHGGILQYVLRQLRDR